MSFETDYQNLLIKQYWEKPKAYAEIGLQAGTWERVFDWLNSFVSEFDLDNATDDRLDIIGRVVGQSRIVPQAVPKLAFGFDENPNARGFDDKFVVVADRAPFQDKFSRAYTDLQLDDTGYRLFIRARISKNIGSPYLVEDEAVSIGDAVLTLFEGLAYVVDNKNMTLTLYVSPTYNIDILTAIVRIGLLPKPQGVGYLVVQAAAGESFGFSDNVNALPFADKFDLVAQPGGKFANKVII